MALRLSAVLMHGVVLVLRPHVELTLKDVDRASRDLGLQDEPAWREVRGGLLLAGNDALSYALKRAVAAPRPRAHCEALGTCASFGMPSMHAQFAAFLAGHALLRARRWPSRASTWATTPRDRRPRAARCGSPWGRSRPRPWSARGPRAGSGA